MLSFLVTTAPAGRCILCLVSFYCFFFFLQYLSNQGIKSDNFFSRELTLFWSKLLKRLESDEKTFLDKCCQMSLLSKTVYHILFFIKVIQSEVSHLFNSPMVKHFFMFYTQSGLIFVSDE